MGVLPRNQDQRAARVAPKDGAEEGVELGVELEEALRTAVQVAVGGQAELLAALHGGRRSWSLVIDGEVLQADQLLRVVRLGPVGFEQVAREEVVDGGDAAGQGMAPGHALHGRQPGERQEVREWVHAEVGVEQHVQPLPGDTLPGQVQVLRQRDDLVGALPDGVGHRVVLARRVEEDDAEIGPRQAANQPGVEPPDGVVVKEA